MARRKDDGRCLICYASVAGSSPFSFKRRSPVTVNSDDCSSTNPLEVNEFKEGEFGNAKDNFEEAGDLSKSSLPVSQKKKEISTRLNGENNRNNDTLLLSNQLEVIFLMKKIFEVPTESLESYLKNWGSPDVWVRICETCCGEVDKTWLKYNEILGKIREFAEIRRRLVILVKGSSTEDENAGGNRQRSKRGGRGDLDGVTTEVRRIINEQTYATINITCPIIRTSDQCPEFVIPKEEVSPLEEEDEDLDQYFVDSPLSPSPTTADNEDNSEEDHENEDDNYYRDDDDMDPNYEPEGGEIVNEKEFSGTSNGQNIECHVCGKVCKDSRGYKNHLRFQHNQGVEKPKKYVCNVPGCETEFTWKQSWKAHMKRYTREAQFKCEICGREFFEKQSFQYHMTAHKRNTIPTKLTPGKTLAGRKRKVGLSFTPANSDKVDVGMKTLLTMSDLRKISDSPNVETEVGVNGKGNFFCKFCGKDYTTEQGLKLHISRIHCKEMKKRTEFSCHVEGCGKVFTLRKNWIVHLKSHGAKSKYKCDICGNVMYDPESFQTHKEAHEPTALQDDEKLKIMQNNLTIRKGRRKPDKFTCEMEGCGKEFVWKSSWKAHLLRHTSESNQICGICGRAFYDKESFLYHQGAHKRGTIPTNFVTREPVGRKRVVCPKAASEPDTEPVMENNEDDDDLKKILDDELILLSEDKPTTGENQDAQIKNNNKCQFCGLLYESKRSLNYHIRFKHKDLMKTDKLVCTVEGCGIEYPLHQRQRYKVHMATHKRKFRCRICLREFYVKASFLYHKLAHKRGTARPYSATNVDQAQASKTVRNEVKKPPRPYICDLCGNSFLTKKTLVQHQRTAKSHLGGTDLEKFKCKYCGKGFHVKVNRNNHEKAHESSSKKRFQCDLCGKGFKSSSGLSYHKKYHDSSSKARKFTEKKGDNYLCTICGKGYQKREYLSSHVRFVHEKRFSVYCELCGKGVTCNQHLRLHMRLKHKIFEEGVKEYQCMVVGCRRKYFDKEKYEGHMKEFHSGREGDESFPFKCQYCGRGFWHHHRLRGHVAIHEKRKYTRKRLTTVVPPTVKATEDFGAT